MVLPPSDYRDAAQHNSVKNSITSLNTAAANSKHQHSPTPSAASSSSDHVTVSHPLTPCIRLTHHKLPCVCCSSTLVFQNLEVIDYLPHIQRGGWCKYRCLSVCVFLCVHCLSLSVYVLFCPVRQLSPLVRYFQSADNQHYYWDLVHHQMMEEYSSLTATPLPHCSRLPWDNMSAIFGSGVIRLQMFCSLHTMQSISQSGGFAP